MIEKVRNYMAKYHMIVPGDKVIVGVSGGADSVCLFSMLIDYQKELPFAIVAVHVNHNLRGVAADADEAYVKQLCAEAEIPLIVRSVDVADYARVHKQSLEEAGRDVRREAFARAKESYGGTKIATAHHGNDSAETMLMNLARGSGLKGLGGILPVQNEIIRPLLCVQRREIEAYLKERNISYCTDESNASDDYTRNRIRNHVIPYMEQEINEKCVAHMNETMEQLRGWQEYISAQMEMLMQKGTTDVGAGVLLLEEAFRREPKVLQMSAILSVMKRISGQEKDLTAVHASDVQQLFAKQVGRKGDLPYGMHAERTYEGVLIRRDRQEKSPGIEPKELVIPGDIKTECIQVNCTVLTDFSLDAIPQKAYTKWFDYDIIESGIVIRSRQAGDFISIGTDGGTQKLKSYFTNEKIPASIRDTIPLIADGSHILWVLGHRVSTKYHVNANTKRVLQIQIKKVREEESELTEEK